LSKPQPDYTCQEQGRVAVQVSVDRNGNTISVTAGVQGTTNTAKCLLDQAKIAAMNTKWQADSNAPEKQVGKIIYTFSLN
jgi:outer membrane biosynthesis protein TonB